MNPEQVIANFNLDSSLPEPLHSQIRAAFEQSIRLGELHPGERLPNVNEMAKLMNVSLGTASKALASAQSKGIIVSKRGVGTLIAPIRAGAIEIIMGHYPSSKSFQPSKFQYQLLNGVSDSFGDSERSIMMTAIIGQLISPAEFITSLHARRIESIIAYRPVPELYPQLTAAAKEMPVVSLFQPIPNSAVDCVLPSVDNAIEEMLKARIAAGKREFAIALSSEMQQKQDKTPNIYTLIQQTFRQTVEKAGFDCYELIIKTYAPGKQPRGQAKLHKPDGTPLKPGTVILAQTPRVIENIEPNSPGMYDIITYTEYLDTLRQLRDQVSMIYFGLDNAGKEAVRIIRERELNGREEGCRTIVKVIPEIYDLRK